MSAGSEKGPAPADLPDERNARAIWSSFAQALDCELRDDTVIRGSSGIDHAVQAIAVDDRRKRVIIVSAEPNPRMAAMMQVDVQATMPNARVLVARPVTVDLPDLLRRVVGSLGLGEIDIARARGWIGSLQGDQAQADRVMADSELVNSVTGGLIAPGRAGLPAMPQILSFMMQAEALPWSDILAIFKETASTGTLDLSALLATDSMEADLAAGVCPLPLFELDADDMDLLESGRDIAALQERLRALGIYQYFFPARDQVALGLIDKGLRTGAAISAAGRLAPELGHPFGQPELIDGTGDFTTTLEELKEAGYLAEGEINMEISDAGRTVRSTIKVRPREGVLTKLLNRFNVTVSPLDLL